MRKPYRRLARFARLILTRLEDRTTPTAGLSVSLSGGILRITDYLAADAIAVHQSTTGVTLDAAGDHLSYAGVTRVMLDVQNNAKVTNDVTGLNGKAAREVYLSRRDSTGAKFVSAGDLAAGATSGPSNTTVPTPPAVPPAPATDWFDAGISDANLRALTRSLSTDGALDRNDWLKLFAQVEADGNVSAGEFHDLGDLLHTTRVTTTAKVTFTLSDSVRALAGDIVDGNTANAYFQGTVMGNLAAGSGSGQLQKLVAKWFLGADHPAAAAGATYRIVSGSLFVGGPAYSDVVQGAVGDCYFVAALADVARYSPQVIQQMFTDNGDGTFTVRFYNNGVANYVTVDRALPTTSAGRATYASFGGVYTSTSNELWVALAEKAYAQMNAAGWLGHAAANSYAGIDGGYSDLAIEHISGTGAGWKWLQYSTPADLVSAVAAGKFTVLASKSGSLAYGVVADHGYALIGYNAATGGFTLFNPWGSAIELSWAALTQTFNGFWMAGL
jgi:hypothetical protein